MYYCTFVVDAAISVAVPIFVEVVVAVGLPHSSKRKATKLQIHHSCRCPVVTSDVAAATIIILIITKDNI